MAPYILKRLLWLVPVLFFISLATFLMMHAIEGGPFDGDTEPPRTEQARDALNRQYGLDKPVWRQYVIFVGHALQGDLGVSFSHQFRPATEVITSGFHATVVLGLTALGLAVVAGVSLGAVSALNRNRWPDYAGVAFASMGSAVPGFVLGVLLIYLFGVELRWLPTFGWDTRHGLVQGWVPQPRQMVLPVITLAALPTAYLARITRASLLDVLRQDYMRTARAKGLGRAVILYRHALRNAAIPIITVIGPMAAALVTGSFIVEYLFSVPGTGRMFVQGVEARDYGLIMGTTLFYATVIVVANLAVDVAYTFVDPRLRHR